MTHRRTLTLALATLGLVAGTSLARADVLFDNTTQPQGGFFALNGAGSVPGDTIGQSFAYTGGTITNITLALSGDPTSAGSFTLEVVADTGSNAPDLSTVYYSTTVLDSSLSGGTATASLISFPVSISGLAAGNDWIVLDGNPTTTANWWFTNSTDSSSGPPILDQFYYAASLGGSTSVNDPTFPGAQIMSVTTPEPATLGILGVGLAGLGLVRRLRRAA